MAVLSIRARLRTAGRWPRVAAALAAALLLGTLTGAAAFTGAHPELVSNANWPGSAVK